MCIKQLEESLKNHKVIAMKIDSEVTPNWLISPYLHGAKFWEASSGFQDLLKGPASHWSWASLYVPLALQ